MSKTTDLHEYLISRITIAMQRAGVDAGLARSIADEVDHDIRSRFGSQEHYIPAPDRRKRNQRIIDCWKSGMKTTDIAATVGVHQSTVSRIITSHLNKQTAGFGRDGWNL